MTESAPKRVLLTGATGTIGRAVLTQLIADGHTVVCYGRSRGPANDQVSWRIGSFADPKTTSERGIEGEQFDAVISCLASRTGTPSDAWAVDHRAQSALLKAAQQASVPQFILLSAICVQKPRLAFQHAKLAFENELMASGLNWTIVRPTAYFKSLSGQVARVKAGKPYLMFGDGRLTACKPISDRDLAAFIVRCLADTDKAHRILPIGGPGPALTPRDMGEHIAARLGRPLKFSTMPVAAMRLLAGTMGVVGTVIPPLRSKAALARIGLYYGTESMLVWDDENGRYDAGATPEFGADTLFEHFDQLLSGTAQPERGDHAVF